MWNGTDPICSTISLALVMMFAPVQHTIPAISIEYQRALGKGEEGREGRGGEGRRGGREGTWNQRCKGWKRRRKEGAEEREGKKKGK